MYGSAVVASVSIVSMNAGSSAFPLSAVLPIMLIAAAGVLCDLHVEIPMVFVYEREINLLCMQVAESQIVRAHVHVCVLCKSLLSLASS